MQPLRPIVSGGRGGWKDLVVLAVVCLAAAMLLGALVEHENAPAEPPPDGPAPARTNPARTESHLPPPSTTPSESRAETAAAPAAHEPAAAEREYDARPDIAERTADADPKDANPQPLTRAALARRAVSRRGLSERTADESHTPPNTTTPTTDEPSVEQQSPPQIKPVPAPPSAAADDDEGWSLRRIGRVALDAVEIPAFDAPSGRVFASCKEGVGVVSLNNKGAAMLDRMITLDTLAKAAGVERKGAGVTHVEADPAGRGFVVALVAPSATASAPGAVVFLSTETGEPIASLRTGFLPDACAFTPDGAWLVIANEGEPAKGAAGDTNDPQGSVSIVDQRRMQSAGDLTSLGSSDVRHVMFVGAEVDRALAAGELRIRPQRASSPALDIEPESVCVADGAAYITLQENNAIAALDIERGVWSRIAGLGVIEQSIDGTDDGAISIAERARCLPCPDTIAAFTLGGRTLLFTANEGDARDDDETKAARDAGLWLGSRSASVWDARSLTLVGDTGSALEWTMAQAAPEWFNANDKGRADARSNQRGPEPEGVAVWKREQRPIGFIGVERPGAIAIVDLAKPESPRVLHLHVSAREDDFAPERMAVIDAVHSPTGAPLLLAAYEASGTLCVYEITAPDDD